MQRSEAKASAPRVVDWGGYAEAVVVVALFAGIRWVLQPFVGFLIPYFFFLLATAVTIWRRGTGPAILAAFLGHLFSKAFFQQSPFLVYTKNDTLSFATYALLCTLLIVSSHYLRKSSERLAVQAADLSSTRDLLSMALSTGRIVAFDWDTVSDQVTIFGDSKSLIELPDQTTGDEVLRNFVNEDRMTYRLAIERAVNMGTQLSINVRYCLPSTAETRWFATTVTPQGSRIVGVAMDITEYRDAERRKDEYLATLAHELRNPLAPLVSGLEIALSPKSTGEGLRTNLQMMQRQVKQLTQLVDGLMDLTRISRGKLLLDMNACDVSECLRSAIETIGPLAKSASQTVLVDIAPGPIYVQADKLRLTQTLTNLAMNAFKFTPDGGKLSFRCRVSDGWAIVEVEDNGVGIAPENLRSVFDRFAQPQGGPTHRPVGLGVGLSLCKEIMELHGGEVLAASPGLGKGSTFTVRLRVVAAPEERKPAEIPVAASMALAKVLVVDDNQDAADALAVILRESGHSVEVAYGAHAALECCASNRPDIVLVDLGMPEMDGYELANEIQKRHGLYHPKLVAVTGWGQQWDLKKTKEAGFFDHLVKPVPAEALHACIARSLSTSESAAAS